MKLFEIENIIKQLQIPNFRGIFLRDQLPTKPNSTECGIIHSHTSKEDIDSVGHWSAYYKKNDKKYYFCPFGGDPYDELKQYLGLPILVHNFKIQEFDEACCAEYSITFLLFMNKRLSYEDVVLFLVR